MKDLAPTPPEDATRRRWVGRGLLLLALAATAWVGWREYDHRAAIREAEAAGFVWIDREPIALIRADWRAAFQKETWTESYWALNVGAGRDLASLRPLLLRLRPTVLRAWQCQDTNLDALQGLSRLKTLILRDCPALQNVDALQGLSCLQSLDLSGCTGLEHTGALAGLLQLDELSLAGCTGLHGADAFQGLAGLGQLKELHLSGCTGLEHTGALAGLHQLEWLNLWGCTDLHGADALQGLAGLGQLKSLFLNGCTGLERGAVLEKMKELGLKCYIEGP